MSEGETKDEGAELPPETALRGVVLASFAVFVPLTLVLFHRYALSPATVVSDAGDPLLLIWVMEWVERALLHSPGALFDAPMFHPFRDTLAYTDPLIPHALLAWPLRALGMGPIAAFNVVFLAGIAATGVLCSALFFQLTRSRSAAIFGALVATYPAIRLFHLAHAALQVTLFWPLTFLLVHRAFVRPGARTAVLLGLTLAVATLGSLYYGMFLALLLPPFALASWACKGRPFRALVTLAAGGALAGLVLLPVGRVYSRAVAHLAQPRVSGDFADLSDYFRVSTFADLSGWLPGLAVQDRNPLWLGGGAALLLPVTGALVALHYVRRWGGPKKLLVLPAWARTVLPYSLLGCLSLALCLGPELTWHGRDILPNPFGFLVRLPGANNIRDFPRAGFVTAVAGGAAIAVTLAELRRRAPRWYTVALVFVGVSTLVPAFSSSLPAFRPPPPHAVDGWIEDQPEPFVLYEAPLGPRGETESLVYLWRAVHHRKRLAHGFSGYLPLTDDALRDQADSVHRPDFFRSLAVLGVTHLLVHTRELEARPEGRAALTSLREARGADLVARFDDEEVYRVPAAREVLDPPGPRSVHPALLEKGGWVDQRALPRRCVEVAPDGAPLVLHAPPRRGAAGLRFVSESQIGRMDDAIRFESSGDLLTWQPIRHRPLLSTTLASYVREPTQVLWTRAVFESEAGPFLRISDAGAHRVRLCDVRVESAEPQRIAPVERTVLRLTSNRRSEIARLAADGDPGTRWDSGGVQDGNEFVEVELSKPVGPILGVVLELGASVSDFGRRLALDCVAPLESRGVELEGRVTLFEHPRMAQVLPFPASRPCDKLRIRQTARAGENFWSIAELEVLVAVPAPSPATASP